MDGVSIDDQFSKLHPCFPPQTRIAVVGAGPSGLSTAYALCKLGYSDDKAKASGRIGVHAVSEIAPDLAPEYLENQGFPSVPKSVIYGYTASGYGYVQDMPYAYIHEFTRTSMAGKIRRFKGGYMSLWKKLSERFVGGLMAFELTERNSSYAFELVRKHFSNDNPDPSYPYVKVMRMFTRRR